MDIHCVEERRFYTDFRRDGAHIRAGRIDAFFHHIAQLTRGFHPALAWQFERLDLQQIAAHRRIGEPGHNTDLILFLSKAITMLFHPEEFFEVVIGDGDRVILFAHNFGDRLAGDFGEFTFQVPHPRLAGIVADHVGDRRIRELKFLGFEAVVFDLFRDQVLFGNL